MQKKWETEDSYYYINEWGTKYRKPKDQGLYFDLVDVVLADAKSEVDDEKFIWPTPSKFDPSSRKELEDYRAAGYATTISEVFGNGFFQTGPLSMAIENWFMMMGAEPERCRKFMDNCWKRKLNTMIIFLRFMTALSMSPLKQTTSALNLGLWSLRKCSEK